jgi:flagellar biogenesis protein FliO
MLGKLILLIVLVALAFWLLTKFRDSGRGRR